MNSILRRRGRGEFGLGQLPHPLSRHSPSRYWQPALEQLEPRIALAGQSLDDFYTQGQGFGLGFQQLQGFGLATTYGTTIAGGAALSALEGRPTEHATGSSPLRQNFQFNPAFLLDNPQGNLIGWRTDLGGTAPWLVRPELVGQPGAVQDLVYPTRYPPDSAETATALYTGVKTYRGAIGVDIYEQPVQSVLELAQQLGKSTGTVSSVPLNHATPAAAISHTNYRTRRDAEYPDLDNSLQQALLQVKPTVVMGGGHPEVGGQAYVRTTTLTALRKPADGRYDEWTLAERGPRAAERLAQTAAAIDPQAGQHLVGIYGARGQSGNLPWATADGDFSNTGIRAAAGATRPLAEGETPEQFIARERDENPRLFELAAAALDVLEDDPDGFWLMVEGGDIDWGLHDNDIDNAVGSVLEFDLAVETVVNWIGRHGGFDENLLIVTADHDHYLTLHDNYPQLAATRGLAQLTPRNVARTADLGHHWGPDPHKPVGWADHSMIPVPVYYQGPPTVMQQLDQLVGQGFNAYGQPVPGVPGMLDQTHIHQTMRTALSDGLAPNVILMIGDGMGWEITCAAAIASQVQPDPQVYARLERDGTLIISGTDRHDTIQVHQADNLVTVQSDGQAVAIAVGGRLVEHVTSWLVTDVQYFGWDGQDRVVIPDPWVVGTVFAAGDADTDGRFGPRDIVRVLQANKYMSGETASWAEGDWTGDGVFDQWDIVAALQVGEYLR